MTIRHLDALLSPRTVALVGATDREGTLGRVLTRNLLAGGFRGEVWPVNRRHDRVAGRRAWRDVRDLPAAPDLAVIAIPPPGIPDLIRELGRLGTRAAIVISAGFAELGTAQGRELQQAILDAARPYLLRVMGPNCLGLLVPGTGLNASFAHLQPRPGGLALVSQSGAILTSLLDWAESRHIGFSHLISVGNMADVDTGDLLDYLALDHKTSAILLYLESVHSVRKFFSAGRGAARAKPVIVVKSGRRPAGQQAAASHTAALAGADEVYDAAFRRAGMLRVDSLEELFDAAEVLSTTRTPRGRRAAILTNGGGAGVLAADAVVAEGGKLAELAPRTLQTLDEVLPATWSHGNPVDIIGDAPPSRYAAALQALYRDPGVDVVLALNCPTAMAGSREVAEAVAAARPPADGPLLITGWLGQHEAAGARRWLTQQGIPSYPMPEQAVRAFLYLYRYRRNQENLMETPPSIPADFRPDRKTATELVRDALAEGREWLDEVDSKRLLAAYEIPVVLSEKAADPEQAARIAARLGQAVALKVLSPDILHKSEAGAVLLDIEPAAVGEVATALLERMRREHPQARIEALSVQPMVDRSNAYEVFMGMTEDPVFGPAMLFGEGGEAVEVIGDRSIGLPPLNMHLARDMIRRTRINRRLRGFRSRPPVDRDALAFTLVKLSQLVADLPEVRELDVNPLIVSPRGVMALDGRMRLAAVQPGAPPRLPIRPYPTELEETVHRPDGSEWLLRPIRPEDEPALQRMFRRMTPEEVRLRFMGPLKTLSHAQAARYSQLDYDREMALALFGPGREGADEIAGIVRISADPDNIRAEYAILVLGAYKGQGLGTFLMQRIIRYARERGIGEIYGSVLSENAAMLALCRQLGFRVSRDPDEYGVMHVSLPLDTAPTVTES